MTQTNAPFTKKLSCAPLLCALLCCTLLQAIVLFPADAPAETRYAKPALDVAVRSSPSNKGEIIASINLAEPVELLENEGEWSRIGLADGVSGWVRTRHLSNAPFVPADAFQPGTVSGKVLMDAENAFKEINAANAQLKQDLASCTTDRNTLEDKYATLTNDPNSILHTKNSLEDARTQLGELEEKLAQAQIENKALKMNQSIMWFLAGGGALFLGWLLGRFFSGGRKKRTSLY